MYAPFSLWAGTVTLNIADEPNGDNARLYYLAKHTLDGTGSTLPEELEDVLATGAGAYAAIEYASFAIDRLNTGDGVPERFRSWGEARLRCSASTPASAATAPGGSSLPPKRLKRARSSRARTGRPRGVLALASCDAIK